MTTSAQLIERSPGIVDLALINRPNVAQFVIGAQVTLNGAYAGTSPMMTVPKGAQFMSKTLLRTGMGRIEESTKGMTRVVYCPNDYATVNIPGDGSISFVRVSEIDYAGVTHAEGHILVVPPANYLRSGKFTMFLSGTAPDLASPGNGLPNPLGMWIELPRFLASVTLYNDGAKSLCVAPGLGFTEFVIPSGESLSVSELGTNELIFRGDTGTTDFRFVGELINGLQG